MNLVTSSSLLRRTTALRRIQTALVAVALTAAFTAPSAFAQKKQPKNFDLVPTTITSVVYQSGTTNSATFLVSGLAGAKPFTTLLTMTAQDAGTAQEPGASCPILNLQLAPINLSLLGLNVDTSAICLDVTAVPGALLGDLLCAVANLLNGGLAASGLLDLAAGLTPDQMTQLQNALTSIIDGALDAVTASENLTAQEASCEILSLAVGPLDLNLLGLRVELDNCADGPVTVDLTATPGGGLLGDLLCSLSDLLNTARPNQQAIQSLLRNLATLIGGLLG